VGSLNSITVEWMGPYSFDQLTPKELRRKMGIYAVLHDSNYLFIGQTKRGKAIFREAKVNREEEYWRGLRKLGVVGESKPAWYKLKEDVYSNCELYAGVVSKDDFELLEDLRRLLVFKLKPVCNEKFVKVLESKANLYVTYRGTPPPGLEKLEPSL
jgi:hypothetical protein